MEYRAETFNTPAWRDIAFHKSWVNAPKGMQALMEQVGDLQRKKPAPAELIAYGVAAASQATFGEDMDEFKVPEQYPLLKTLMPTLAEAEGDIYELGQTIAHFVYQNQHRQQKDKKQSSALAEEFKEELEKLKKGKKPVPANGRGGPEGVLWSGPNFDDEEWFKEPITATMPSLNNLQFIKNASSQSPKEVVGKPKVRKELRYARTIADLKYCTTSQLALPQDLFWLKYAKGEVQISVPKKILTVKQILIVLLDDSGSMAGETKKTWISHIFSHIFKEIEKGNTIMYFSPFVRRRGTLRKVETLEEVEQLKKDFRRGSGGGTYLNDILPPMIKEIQSGKIDGYEVNPRTEMLIINDGQDPVEIFESPIPIHSITVEEVNEDLKGISFFSGGQYFQAAGRSITQII